MKKGEHWTPKEDGILRKYHRDMDKLTALLPGRSMDSIDHRMRRLKLTGDILDSLIDDPTIEVCLNCKFPPSFCNSYKCGLTPFRTSKGIRNVKAKKDFKANKD